MKTIFLGSGAVAEAVLKALRRAGFEPELVITQPPRARRRRGSAEPTQVQVYAESHGIEVFAPENVNAPESLDRLRSAQARLYVVAEYGQILSQEFLDIPELGAVNVHTSLLPRHRGAAPVAAAILAGDEVTGVSIQKVVRRLDAGPVLAERHEPIREDDDRGSLTARLAVLGGELAAEVVGAFADGNPPAERAQDESAATYIKRFTSADREVDWSRSAEQICRSVRAMSPKPGVRTSLLRDPPMSVRVLAATHVDAEGSPGQILGVFEDALRVAAGTGAVDLRRVLPAGKRPMSGESFKNGYRVAPGERFGPEAGEPDAESPGEAE
ncbi:MAG: methionyl-tRNA formyltransferase [Planctomycetota bacterium]